MTSPDDPLPHSDTLSDQELIRRTQEDDPTAFDLLIERYQKRLYSVIYNVVLNHEDTNDVLMETLTKAYRSIHGFKADAAFYTWIYRIAINTAINQVRKRRRTPQTDVALDEEEGAAQRPEFIDGTLAADTERQIGVKELQNKLNESLEQLSEEHRTVVNLFDIQGLSHVEIAKVMRCSEGTVRSRLHYAHKQLQKLLKNYIQ